MRITPQDCHLLSLDRVFHGNIKLKSILLTAGAGVLLVSVTVIPVLRSQQRAADDLFSGTTPLLRRLMADLIMRRVAERLRLTSDQKLAVLGVLRTYQHAFKPLVDQFIKERFALRKTTFGMARSAVPTF